MHLFSPATALCSNHTEPSPRILLKRAAYVAAHREYFDYLCMLLDRAALPHCNVHLPNLTTIAAMVAELQDMNPTLPWLNSVVLGRVLHRLLPGLLKWHGSAHSVCLEGHPVQIHLSTTCYRFPEVGRARIAYEMFSDARVDWSNYCDQWQSGSIFDSNSSLQFHPTVS
jgi:hypothetical protein